MNQKYIAGEVRGNEVFHYNNEKIYAIRRIKRGEATQSLLVLGTGNKMSPKPVPTLSRLEISRELNEQLLSRSKSGDEIAKELHKSDIYFINEEVEPRNTLDRTITPMPGKPRLPWQQKY